MIEYFVFLAEFHLHTRTAGAKVVGGGGGHLTKSAKTH